MEYFELGGGEGDEALLPQIFWADLQTRANQQLLHYECQECPEIVKINHLPINWGWGGRAARVSCSWCSQLGQVKDNPE